MKTYQIADLHLPALDHGGPSTTSSPPVTNDTSPKSFYHPIPDGSSPNDSYEYNIQCIDTPYFDTPTLTANFAKSTLIPPFITEPIDTLDIIFDPLHYLHYSSWLAQVSPSLLLLQSIMTLSPTTLKHYLKHPKVITNHLDPLQLTTNCRNSLPFLPFLHTPRLMS